MVSSIERTSLNIAMTLFKPHLQVGRLIVIKDDNAAYDEHFREGVNIIRGENSSGKSTILNFLFYGLGGDLREWSEHALLCERVVVEVYINGNVATLSRDIQREPGRDMDIFGGPIVEALAAPRTQWIKYPYRRSASRESFSQALFRLLEIPEVTSDDFNNITMHQILRILYSDQLTPVENLFRFERFDTGLRRETIGRLLCGAFDDQLYVNELRIRELDKVLEATTSQLSSLYAVLGKVEHSLTIDWVMAQRSAIQQELARLQQEAETAEKSLYAAGQKDELTLKAQADAFQDVQELQVALAKKAQEREAISLEIVDFGCVYAEFGKKACFFAGCCVGR